MAIEKFRRKRWGELPREAIYTRSKETIQLEVKGHERLFISADYNVFIPNVTFGTISIGTTFCLEGDNKSIYQKASLTQARLGLEYYDLGKKQKVIIVFLP